MKKIQLKNRIENMINKNYANNSSDSDNLDIEFLSAKISENNN